MAKAAAGWTFFLGMLTGAAVLGAGAGIIVYHAERELRGERERDRGADAWT
jgi:hypothetical protein